MNAYIEPPAVVQQVAMIMGDAFKNLEEGMSKDEVIRLLGKPSGFQRVGEVERLTYSNRLISGWAWDRTNYYVDFTDGKVVGYGNGEVRDRRPNTLLLVPLKPPT